MTQNFPKDELFGLTSQMRRACFSIPANIAEGAGRDSVPERLHFLQISHGSASELQYYLLLAKDLSYIPVKTYEKASQDLTEIKRMLTGLMKSLKTG